MQAIHTKRLLLRDFGENDWQAVHDYASDPKVVRYMDWGPNSEEETRGFVHRALATQKERPRRNYTLGIVLRAKNRLIGGCGIHVSNPNNREGWIGYCLNRHFWEKEYATETANALIDFGFKNLDMHRIFATCDTANTASAHVLEKSGMKREGHIREHKWTKAGWRNSFLYSILEQEWKPPRHQRQVCSSSGRR